MTDTGANDKGTGQAQEESGVDDCSQKNLVQTQKDHQTNVDTTDSQTHPDVVQVKVDKH